MQEAIRRAIEGGYTNFPFFGIKRQCKVVLEDNFITATEEKDNEGWKKQESLNIKEVLENPYKILLDPEFWKCLRKTEGWETQFDEDKGFNYQWKDYWHNLLDHLAEGKDIESYFKELLN